MLPIKQKKTSFVVTWLITLAAATLAACTASGPTTTLSTAPSRTPEAQPSVTQFGSPTGTSPPNTHTATESRTPATVTPLPTSSPTAPPPATATPGLDTTVTPAPPAECPQPSGQNAVLSPIPFGTGIDEGFAPQLIDYLNTRGSASGLETALELLTLSDGETNWLPKSQVFTIDVTGDTTADVVMDLSFYQEGQYSEGYLFVFTCSNGAYEGAAVTSIWGQVLSDEDPDPGIRFIWDLNQNGVPEIIVSYIMVVGTHANYSRLFQVLEWDGEQFVDLIQGGVITPNTAEVLNGDGVIRDTDQNGTLELVLTNGIGRGPGTSILERPWTDIWAWDGAAFTRKCSAAQSPPIYRFQAMHDGDDATLCGDYEQALRFYQDAIFNEELMGWSQGRNSDVDFVYEATPTPDPEERPRLSAYSRYRILLLHTIQGFLPEAQIVYDTLVDMFPPDTVGHEYAELATTFWESYQSQADLAQACQAAIEFARENEDQLLRPLGSDFYGFGQRNYTPEDICPFGPSDG